MLWWSKKRPQIKLITVLSNKIRLEQWRENKTLVGMAQTTLKTEALVLMLQCAANESPGNFSLPMDATPDMRAAHQARTEGYNMALANLEAMGMVQEQVGIFEPTFEDTNDQLQPTES
jgi:hypothetical protein